MDDFEKELKAGFLEEAAQNMADVEQCFLALERDPNDASNVDQIFRLAHNLKGSSKAVGFDELGLFTHEFESFLLKVKNKQIAVSEASVGLMLRTNDRIRTVIDSLKNDFDSKTDCSDLIAELQNFGNGNAVAPVEHVEQAEHAEHAEPESNTDVPSADAFNDTPSPEEMALLKASEAFESESQPVSEPMLEETPKLEVVSAPPVAAAPTIPTPQSPAASKPAASASSSGGGSGAAKGNSDETIRVSLDRVENLINFVGELVILQTILRGQSYANNPLLLRKTIHQMGKVTKDLQDISMGLRMVPLKQTFLKMQRIVRDTSALLGKKVNLQMEGEDTELDKTVLERLGDPLVHLIRNAVDHGIEDVELRRQRGKPDAGTVFLRTFHQGDKLILEIKDDGGGIDHNRLIAKAKEKGILAQSAELSVQAGIELIFAAGFSTKTEVTEVSGRGVGMDVVKKNIEALQGKIAVTTDLGHGTTFRIQLPLTLAIIDGLVVESSTNRYVIPLLHVQESLRPGPNDIEKFSSVGEILKLRGSTLPIFRLNQLFKGTASDASKSIAVIIRSETPFAIIVDDVVGQSQVVIKQLGAELQSQKWFSGTAILGDGKPALVLELNELVPKAPTVVGAHPTQLAQRGAA